MEHRVRPGDCLSVLARRYGFASARELWDLPENAALKEKRRSPNVLHPGDVVFVPERREQTVAVRTGAEHRFRVKVPSVRLRVHVVERGGRALAGKRYQLLLGGEVREGTTGGDGLVDQEIPHDLTSAELRVFTGGKGMGEHDFLRIPLAVGHLDPVEETSGVLHRLHNLGYAVGSSLRTGDVDLDDDARDALRDFQLDHGLEPTGEIDDATRDELLRRHKGV